MHYEEVPSPPLDKALVELGPAFTKKVRERTRPVRDRLFAVMPPDPDHAKDGLYKAPPYLSDPELKNIVIELAESAVKQGIDVNLAAERNGDTLLHAFVLIREPEIAAEVVKWLLAHGADPNVTRDDGETPLTLALKLNRTELVELMRRG